MKILEQIKKIKEKSNFDKINDLIFDISQLITFLTPCYITKDDHGGIIELTLSYITKDGVEIKCPKLEKEVESVFDGMDGDDIIGTYKGELKLSLVDFWETFIENLQKDNIYQIIYKEYLIESHYDYDEKEIYNKSIIITDSQVEEFKKLFLPKLNELEIKEDYD